MDRTPFSGEVVKIHQQRVCRGEIAQRGVWELPVVKGIDVFERLLPCLLASGEPLCSARTLVCSWRRVAALS